MQWKKPMRVMRNDYHFIGEIPNVRELDWIDIDIIQIFLTAPIKKRIL